MRHTKDLVDRPFRPGRRRGTSGPSGRRSSRGAITLELILTFPIWLIFLLAVVEFGQILSNQQQVALASRVGAEEASQTAALPLTDGGSVPENVLEAIDQQLTSSGISRCHVILEHNVVPPDPPTIPVPVTLSSGTCCYEAPATDLAAMRQYVRVTVCVKLTEVAPNLLSTFGFDISDRTLQYTTTFRHELY